MAKSKRAHPAQMTLLGTAAPNGEENPTQQPLPEPEEEKGQASTKAKAPKEPESTPERNTASRDKAKPGMTIHHHLIVDDRITSCHRTLSQAMHAQQAVQSGANATTTIESYAGDSECRRK